MSEPGGFLIPNEFAEDLKIMAMKAVLKKMLPDFKLPVVPDYVTLKQRVERLPALLRRHYVDYYDSIEWPCWLPFWYTRLLYHISLIVNRMYFSKLHRQWREITIIQWQTEREATIEAWVGLGYTDSAGEAFRRFDEICGKG